MDPHQFIRELCQEHARHQARALDEEIILWLRMGYRLEELRIVHHREGLTWVTQVWPESMLPASPS